ncbi:hypothetical protein [Streptomyces camelliae]|uniref:Uncharacterized protein n=1 Tax=Streptomyces camelliae TaxID=3004093 RepID=A0ABY7PGM8_9ACTN|nr:hypothetical protein [Streptomyces sp. HUAS 2-6]WBO69789.1 hypothetical protein O1G22_43545 [Streptomyces sp. HUAS 2-6]
MTEANMTVCRTCAILGFQTARPGTGRRLAELNLELGRTLDVAGLLRLQVLVRAGYDTDLCVYWLWRDLRDRDAVWAAPPTALTHFWASARPLWAAEPSVRRLHWQPATDRDLCPPNSGVLLEERTPVPATSRRLAPEESWLLDMDTGTALHCRPPSTPADPTAWTALWQRPATP